MTSENTQKLQSEGHAPEEVITPFTCQERLDCFGPDAFRDSVQGAWDVKKEYVPLTTGEKPNVHFRTELDPDDVKLVNELGQLSADKLMEYVRTLQATSLSLGEEEARQFMRAKCLNIFGKQNI